MSDLSSIVSEIKRLPHFCSLQCQGCSTEMRVHALQIYAECPKCGRRHKCRALAASGSEIQDVIDAVLGWAGSGEEFDAVMKRRDQIIAGQR
jgi:hypothetical protein